MWGEGLGELPWLFSLVVSLKINLLAGNKNEKVKKSLLSPIILRGCCWMPQSWRQRIDFEEPEEVRRTDLH